MKKIISFLLAAVLLVSAVPMAYAAETTDYTNGTAVTYTATGTEEWTVTVPAQLAPGGSGTVALEGTWASDRVVSVTADKNVVLTNSIKAADQKTLNISFPGIDEYGSNTTSQTFTETVSVAGISDALFGTWSGRFYYNVAVYNAVDYLQVKYPFDYYSTMNLAVTDVNNGTIGASADIAKENKENAVAGIYTDENGGVNVVLLQDSTETATVSPAVDMTINLGGHVLSSTDTVGLNITAGNVAIDGRLNGSTIQLNHTQSTGARTIVVDAGANLAIDSGTYICNTEGDNSQCIRSEGNLILSNAVVIGTETTGYIYTILTKGEDATISNCSVITTNNEGIGIGIGVGGPTTISDCSISTTAKSGAAYGVYTWQQANNATITNCSISTTVTDGRTWGINNNTTLAATDCEILSISSEGSSYGFTNTSSATVSDCAIKAFSNYKSESGSYSKTSNGVASNSTLTLNNCYVIGTHSGVQNEGTLFVNGGTYEGYGHGGFYFCGAGTTSYVRNATIRECAMPDGYTDSGDGYNGAGFYIGDNNDMKIYMDNCDIYGSRQPIVLRGTDGEQNNSLYISNSRINKNYTMMGVRVDNDTHRLYIGQNCNFDISDCAPNPSQPQFDMSTAVFETDEVYIMN